MMEEGKALFIKLGPKKKGKGNMVEKGIVILYKNALGWIPRVSRDS
jgi:hypothetical protein